MREFIYLFFPRKDRQFRVGWLSVVLSLVLILVTGPTFAQNKDALAQKITYKVTKASLSNILKDVRKTTNVRFSYSSELLKKKQPVTVDVTDVPLRDFLNQVLGGCGLDYSEEIGVVIIYEKKAEAPVMPGKEKVPTKISILLRGQVTDQNSLPLSGVSVRGSDSKEMTMTNDDGIFVLFPKVNETITFSRVGMKTFTYHVVNAPDSFVRFTMDTAVRELQEVVVTGYQKIDAKLATGSYVKLKGSEIVQPGVSSVDQMLQGKVPGLMVVNTSGSVNSSPKMRIRGTSTLVGNASPLIVVDGMVRPDPVNIDASVLNNLISDEANANYELMGNAISGINVFDIESLTFLRDAAATAIYGTRAANGVIVINTKRGKAGAMQINYNSNVSFQTRPTYKNLDVMNSKERIQLSREMEADGVLFNTLANGLRELDSYEGLRYALYSRNISQEEFNLRVAELETNNTDWFKELFRNQIGTQHNLSISGGSGKTTYYASANYSSNRSAAKKDGNNKYGVQLALRTDLGNRLSLDLSMNTSVTNSTGYYSATVNPYTYAVQTSRTVKPDLFYPMRSENIDVRTGQILALGGQYVAQLGNPLYFNMQHELDHTTNETEVRTQSVNLNLDYKISSKWKFVHQSNIMLSEANGFSSFDDKTYLAADLRGWQYGNLPEATLVSISALPTGGIANISRLSSTAWGIRNSVDFTTPLFESRDQFNFTLGSEFSSEKTDGVRSTEPGYFPDRGKTFYASDLSRRSLGRKYITDGLRNTVSAYSTVTYSLRDRYIIRGDIRTDGSNRFGQYSNSKFLPNFSVSGRWNAYAEEWFPTEGVLTSFSLTASYGTQGNVVTAVGPNLVGYYDQMTAFDPNIPEPSMRIKSLPYPDLRWEKTRQFNIGSDMSFWKNRLRVGFSYYYKHSIDVVDEIDIPYEYGMAYMFRNGSELYNTGVELAMSIDFVKTKNTTFTVALNTSRNKNRKDEGNPRSDFNSFLDGTGHLPGKPVSGFYSFIFSGLNPENGVPTFKHLSRSTPNERHTDPEAFLVYSGQMDPKITFSVAPMLQYKSFTFQAQLYSSLGSTKRINPPFASGYFGINVPGGFSNVSKEYLNRWRKPGDEVHTNIPSVLEGTSIGPYFVPFKAIQLNGAANNAQPILPIKAYELSDYFTANGSYLRCRSVSLHYRIPGATAKSLGVKNLSLGFNVNNLFTIASSSMKGQDPETNGAGSTALPITRQYAFSINAGF